MKTTLTRRRRKGKSIKLLAVVLVVALLLSLGVTSALAVPQTSIIVHDLPSSAGNVEIEYDGTFLSMSKVGGSSVWKHSDFAAFVFSDIGRIKIDGTIYPKTVLRLGTEGGGTLNIWLELPETYSIVTTVVNGTIDVSEYNIPAGSDRTITYSAASGYHLLSVTVDGSPVSIATYPTSYDFTNILADHTVDVVYELDIQPESTYKILTTVTNGTITADESGIAAGSNRTITYSPDALHYLVSVMVDGVNKTATDPNSYTFSDIQEDHAVVVVYDIRIPQEATYQIDTTVVNGTIDPDEAGIDPGENRTINYSPDSGYFLVSVTVNGSPVSIATYQDSYAFTNIQEDKTIVVVYGENVVTDTNTNLLLILTSILLLAGGALIVLSRIKKKVREN